MKYKHVIWDWNGTLLDDMQAGCNILNYMQKKRGLKQTTSDEYKKIFAFPITTFYERAGFIEKEYPFVDLAKEYIVKYYQEAAKCSLHKNAEKVLIELQNKGVTHSILTAGPEQKAKEQLAQYGISEYFRHVTGKQDFYASGKSELIQVHVRKIGYEPDEMVFVGDTMHDVKVAKQIGCDYIIVSHGHQNVDYVSQGKISAVSSLDEVIKIILSAS